MLLMSDEVLLQEHGSISSSPGHEFFVVLLGDVLVSDILLSSSLLVKTCHLAGSHGFAIIEAGGLELAFVAGLFRDLLLLEELSLPHCMSQGRLCIRLATGSDSLLDFLLDDHLGLRFPHWLGHSLLARLGEVLDDVDDTAMECLLLFFIEILV